MNAIPKRRGLAVAALGLAALALLAPLAAPGAALERIGGLLVLTAVFEIAQGFRRRTADSQRSAWLNGAVTLGMGVLLINAPWFAAGALVLFLAGWFGFDAVRRAIETVWSAAAGRPVLAAALGAAGNLAVFAGLLAFGDRATVWATAIAGALRILGAATNIATAPVFEQDESGETVIADLGLPDRPEIAALADEIERREQQRAPVDRGWIAAFGLTLFAIHLGRSGLDRSALGILSPAVAVLGDFAVALLAAYVVIVPAKLLRRRLTRGAERALWSWYLAVPEPARGWRRHAVRPLLGVRLRDAIRLRQARYSMSTAVRRGLQMGLPAAAIIAATAPFFGMSWYFDTENWAAGIWNNWAETRTDTWRNAMVTAEEQAAGRELSFALQPPGVVGDADFSFIVIGDTGEGDASQHVLRDRYLEVVREEPIKFVVVSSDVVYPVGAMRDYETKFWLPFKGTHKPVYAIPGNHDWYDALEAFNATFLTPDAARVAMRARIEIDNRLTSTTDARIEQLIDQATRLRREYEVPTQFQQAPFFQIQTDRFALIAVDTGVARTVDPAQWAWLNRALSQARGKFTMALLGHPFYAGGVDTVEGAETFTAPGDHVSFATLRRLLREHGVTIVMAGDTHDLEYYAEPTGGPSGTIHHFVNGGGGAYLSFGTALAWPDRPPTRDWAFYPDTAEVVSKIEATTPLWKRPMWWWTRRFNAWPYSAEWLSAMFDVNAAPFFQSFVEVAVEPSAGQVRLIPHGVHGRLRWSDLQSSGTVAPQGLAPDAFAEWIVPMPRPAP